MAGIQYEDLAFTTNLGFAAVGTNNGHNGTSGDVFYKRPDVLEDYAYRSVHTGVVVGKQITNMFYEAGFDKSYYLGCSSGGRQGFKSVQKFPEDFDGVVAGAPAIAFLSLGSWNANFLQITGTPDDDTFLSAELWGTVHKEILRQCDRLDGAEDGIIEDTDLCRPFFDTLICSPGQETDCLTGTQVNTVNEVFSPYYGENGTFIYPRMQPGSELSAREILYTGTVLASPAEWFQNVVYEDRYFDPTTIDIHDYAVALDDNPFDIQTWDGDLSAFQATGGKLLSYHGLQDGIISSDNTKRFYSVVAQTMNQPPSELDSFFRFFPISGMAHCSRGDGAFAIGNSVAGDAGPDPEDNVLMAMVKWVEEGIAPETVRGTRFSTEDPTKVEYRRKHCRWPRKNVFKGPGNYTDENSWECV